MDPHILRIVSRGKTPATGRLEHLPKLWLHAPVRFELACAAPEDTAAALAATPTYSISIHSLDASRQPVDDPLLWYDEVASQTANDGKSKGPHAIFDLSAADIANITAAGEYWLAFHAYPGGERIVRAAGYITFTDDGFPTDPPTPTPPGTVYLTQAAGDARYVRDPGTVVDNRLVRWDGTSGNTVQSSLVTVGDDGSISTPGTFTANRVKVKTGTYEGEVTSSLLTNDRAHALPNADGTLALTTNVNGAPDRMELRVKCDEAGGVTLGQAVYIYGANGGNKLIRKAIASGEATSSKTIGLVSQALAHNAFGYVVTEGHVDVSLAKGSAVEGDPVWLSPATAGGVVFGVAAKPSAPNHMVFVGYITRITGNNVTEIFVRVQNGFELEELHNVDITTPSTGHVLTWNGTLWVNSAPTGGGGVTDGGKGDITVTGSGATWTIDNGAVTNNKLSDGAVSNSKLASMLSSTIKGSLVGGTPVDLNAAEATSILAAFAGTAKGLVPGSPGGSTIFLNGNGAWSNITPSTISGSTTVGQNLMQLANPGAITFLRVNAANTVTARSAADFRDDLGLGTLATQSGTFSGTSSGTNTGNVSLAASLTDVLALSSQELQAVTDPGADCIVFFDQSANAGAGAWGYLVAGTGLSISGTTITATFSAAAPGAIGATTPSTAVFTSVDVRTDLDIQSTSGAAGPILAWNTPTTEATNWERASLAWSSNVFNIGTQRNGTGVAREIEIQPGGVTAARFTTDGRVAFGAATPASAATSVTVGAASAALGTAVTPSGQPSGVVVSRAGPFTFAAESTLTSGGGGGAVCGLYSNDGAAMASSDRLGGFLFGGSSSASALRNTCAIFGYATESWTDASAFGSGVSIETTANGSTARSVKVWITGDGNVGIGANVFSASIAPTARLQIRGAGTGTGVALLVENSSGTARFTIRDDGAFAFAGGTVAVAETGWTTFTNLTTDRTCDANATTVEELADILGTLIVALKNKGIIAN